MTAMGSNRASGVAVVGVATTDFGRLEGHDATTLGIWALREAAADAGITLAEIDGLIVHRLNDYQKLIQITNMVPGVLAAMPGEGRMTSGTIQLAVQAILSGMATTVALVYGNDGRSAGARYGGASDTYGTGADQLWAPYGMTSPGAVHAMQFQRHANRFGTSADQLGAISVTFREHALLNPSAVMRKRITLEDYREARFICEPLRLLDYCLINDGGVAMILTRADRARDARAKPVYIHGVAQTSRIAQGEFAEDFGYGAMQTVATRMRSMTGSGPDSVDALMIYDNFTPSVIFALEGFGFCQPGEAGAFVEEGGLSLTGRYPANTSGGHLSESYMQGWALNVEAVRQLRRGLGARQVSEAETVQYIQGGPLPATVVYGTEPL